MRDKYQRQAWTDFVERGRDAQAAVDALCRPKKIDFTVECEAIPQGSMKAVCTTKADGSPLAVLGADNPRTHAYRNQVGFAALHARSMAGVHEIFAAAGVPVRVCVTFVFQKPKSAPASRTRPTVKPDLDKLARSTTDALTGVLWADDAQVVEYSLNKIYGTLEHVQVSVQLVEEG
ncbi:MAG: RusA family crossover junction endodeoxyribonuclease [Terracidiphilus sp.]